MSILATARVSSPAAPGAFFERWADMATWPEWNLDSEWVRLDGPFAEGGTGRLKPKGGFAVPFVIERLVPGREFVDTSRLPGARLTFAHVVATRPDGGSDVEVTVTLTGPLRRLWHLVLGKDVAATVQPDLDRLAATVEGSVDGSVDGRAATP
jgi:hypothetical protein